MTVPDPSHHADAGEPALARPEQRPEASSAAARRRCRKTCCASCRCATWCCSWIVMPLALGRAKSIAAAQKPRAASDRSACYCSVAEADDPTPDQCTGGLRRGHPALCDRARRQPPHRGSGPASASGCASSCPAIRSSRARRSLRRREDRTAEIDARLLYLKESALEALQPFPRVPPELVNAVQSANSCRRAPTWWRASWI